MSSISMTSIGNSDIALIYKHLNQYQVPDPISPIHLKTERSILNKEVFEGAI
jgi:hypothetical protein